MEIISELSIYIDCWMKGLTRRDKNLESRAKNQESRIKKKIFSVGKN